jgi:MoxR-like ATPase
MNTERYGESIRKVIAEVKKAIVGKDEVLMNMMYVILSDGHVLIEDNPGLAKTLMAKSFAAALGLDFKRVQFTPDLLPADITGAYIYDRKTGEFRIMKGPVFTNILLADEINRAPPKTQSALLESMQERQVTIEGETYSIERPFLVIATQNPIEQEGTYPLPEAQVDRFLAKISMGYPNREAEVEILRRRIQRKKDDVEIETVLSMEELVEIQRATEEVFVEDTLLHYITDLTRETRRHKQVEVGASPRGSIAILKLSRARALCHGRDYVTPEDIKAVAPMALRHRIVMKPESWIRGVRSDDVIRDVLSKVPVPKV